jgi:hypothetical protein
MNGFTRTASHSPDSCPASTVAASADHAPARRSGLHGRPPGGAGLSKAHIPSRPSTGTLTCYRGASLLEVRLRTTGIKGKASRKPRGEITEFTDASRRRMLYLMAKIETGAIPFFVTLTYPDKFPLYNDAYKRHLEVFCGRLLRRWPKAAVIWKLEFKERKSGANSGKVAPHYHLFVYNVPWRFPFRCERADHYTLEESSIPGYGQQVWTEKARAGEAEAFGGAWMVNQATPEGEETSRGEVVGADCFKRWVSRNWFDVVASDDLRHYLAGTKVEKLRSVKGAFAYAAKRYVSKKDDMPELEHKPGRFWGVIGRKNLRLGKREETALTSKQADQVRRWIRRYRWANTPPEKRRFLRKSQLWSQEFTAKVFCNVEFWLECLRRG